LNLPLRKKKAGGKEKETKKKWKRDGKGRKEGKRGPKGSQVSRELRPKADKPPQQ